MWRLDPSVQTIWHFEPIKPAAQRLLRIFRWLGLVAAQVRQIQHHVGQIRNGSGESEFVKLLGYGRDLCSKIKKEQLAKNPLIESMESEWARSKVLLYFEKLVEQEVRLECLRIGLVQWLRTQLHVAPEECVLLIKRGQWFSYLQAHAREQGVPLIDYWYPWDLSPTKAASRLLLASREALPIVWKAIQGRSRWGHAAVGLHSLQGQPDIKRQLPNSTIAVRYYHRKLSFDPIERSEFFWLNGLGIPYSEVLLYDYISDNPLDPDTLSQMNERGIRVLGFGPGVPVWFPTRRMFTILLRIWLKLTLGLLTCWSRGQWVSLYYIVGLVALAVDYAYWLDFYATNRARVNVTPAFNSRVGQILALDALDAVSVAYQYSVVGFPTAQINSGENVQFVFSPATEKRWRSIGLPVDYFVHTGFMDHGAVEAIRNLDRVAKIRRELQENGACFILCFFDENTANRWDIQASDKDAARDYHYLLNWLLADPTLGVVFKPKKSASLFQRIACISGLVERVKQTGRCSFLTSDNLIGSVFPAEAALMADVCIGKLLGSTAALEARLAGVPTLLLNIESLSIQPFDTWGRGQVIFDDWESLRVAVERYRIAPQAHPEFGDWSPLLDDFDSFRDGQASLRMGLYIRWVYEALKQGASRQAALAIAAENFGLRWGKQHVTANQM